jgi:hypothetical protein
VAARLLVIDWSHRRRSYNTVAMTSIRLVLVIVSVACFAGSPHAQPADTARSGM